MDPLFSKKFEEAKAEALSKLVKQPEELIARRGRWALTSDSYRRWLYLTDCIQAITVEMPVPMLGDDVISEVRWEGEVAEVSGWNGSYRFHPQLDFDKGKPMQRGLDLLLEEFELTGPQMLEYEQDCIRLRATIKKRRDYSEEDSEDPVEIRLSGVSLLGIYDLAQEFSPDQFYELASMEEEDEEGETVMYRRIVWTAGKRLHLALVQEVELTWVEAEELEPDLDHIFAMMPWQEGILTAEEMDLFVRTYAEIEGEELLPEILESLERFLEDNRNPALKPVKHFYDMKAPLQSQLEAWNHRLELLKKTLGKYQ